MDKNKIQQAATLAGAGLTAHSNKEGKIVVTAKIPDGELLFIKSVDAYGNYDYTRIKSEALRMDSHQMTTRVAEIQVTAKSQGVDIEFGWVYV